MTGGQNGGSPSGQIGSMGPMATGSSNGGSSANMPQWLKGLQLGTQMAQLGAQRGPMPQQMPTMNPGMHPAMATGTMGMPQQGVVPGSMPQQPLQQPGMGGSGVPMQGGMQTQGGMNPQILQMLRARGLA